MDSSSHYVYLHPTMTHFSVQLAISIALVGCYDSTKVGEQYNKVDMLSPFDSALAGNGCPGSRSCEANVWCKENIPTTETLYSISYPWAVGAHGTILKRIGDSWTMIPSGTTKTLRAIYNGSYFPPLVWIVGDGGTILKCADTCSPVDSGTLENLYAIAGRSLSAIWAVGAQGLILHYGGISWTQEESPTNIALYSIGMDAAAAWAVGQYGIFIIKALPDQLGYKWKLGSNATTNSMYGIGQQSNNGFSNVTAVGEHSLVIHLDAWDASKPADKVKWEDVGATGNLYSIFTGRGLNTHWAVGEKGTIINNTTGQRKWLPMPSGTMNTLYSISGEPWICMWAVGDNGTMLSLSSH